MQVDKDYFINGEGNRLLGSGETIALIATGSSMLPFIRPGDKLLISRCEEVAVNDIVLARTGDTVVLHRVVALDGDNITLMGDANLSLHEHCRRTDILATALVKEKGGDIVNFRSRHHRLLGMLWRKTLPVRPLLLRIFT